MKDKVLILGSNGLLGLNLKRHRGEKEKDSEVSVSLIDDENVSTTSNLVSKEKGKKAKESSNQKSNSSTDNSTKKRQKVDTDKKSTSGNYNI